MRKEIYFLFAISMYSFLGALDLTSSLLLLEYSIQELKKTLHQKSIPSGFKGLVVGPSHKFPAVGTKREIKPKTPEETPTPSGTIPAPPSPPEPNQPKPIPKPEVKVPKSPVASNNPSLNLSDIQKGITLKPVEVGKYTPGQLKTMEEKDLSKLTSEEIKKFDKNQLKSLLENRKLSVLNKQKLKAIESNVNYGEAIARNYLGTALAILLRRTSLEPEGEETEGSEWED